MSLFIRADVEYLVKIYFQIGVNDTFHETGSGHTIQMQSVKLCRQTQWAGLTLIIAAPFLWPGVVEISNGDLCDLS